MKTVRMKITANLSTYPPRLDSLRRVVRSIYDQFDEIRVYCNQYSTPPEIDDPKQKIIRVTGPNLTDNGKFRFLDILPKSGVSYDHGTGISFSFVKDYPEYYFTLDDDLIYPPDYVITTMKNIRRFGGIISYHGRKLLKKDVSYYKGHKGYHCLNAVKGNVKVDVSGTGVTAFDTRYFHPKGLAMHPKQLMSDLIFSLEAAKQGKRIGVMQHDAGWIKCISHKETIFNTESVKDQTDQIEIANQIFDLNYGTS